MDKMQIFRGEIDHAPWQLRDAQAIVNENTMTDWLDIKLPETEPLLHFSKCTKVICWPLQRVKVWFVIRFVWFRINFRKSLVISIVPARIIRHFPGEDEIDERLEAKWADLLLGQLRLV